MCVGVVLMASAARSAAVAVPVPVGQGGMLVLNSADVATHHGDTVKWTCASGHTIADATAEPVTAHQSRRCHSDPAAVQRPVCIHSALSPTRPA